MSRRGTIWSPGLAIAVGLTYLLVGCVFFAAGYVIGRVVL
jgi:hypothetical protein